MLPDADELAEELLDLAVPLEDVDDLVRMARRVRDDPELRQSLENAVTGLVHDMGEIRGGADLPDLDWPAGPLQRCFPVYVLVAALPHLRRHHRERGIPADITRRTLADLGRNMTTTAGATAGPASRRHAGSPCTGAASSTNWDACSSSGPRSGPAPQRHSRRPDWT